MINLHKSLFFNREDAIAVKSFINKHQFLDKKSKKIIFWEFGGFNLILKRNLIFAFALMLRGHKVKFVICEGAPVACIQRGLEKVQKIDDWSKTCSICVTRLRQILEKFGVEYLSSKDLISEKDLKRFEKKSLEINLSSLLTQKMYGVNVGELAWSSFNRYMKGFVVTLKNLSSDQEIVLRKYIYAALVNTRIAKKVIETESPNSVVTSHGVYVDYNPILANAMKHGINAISWSSGYSDRLHFFTVPKEPNKLQLHGLLPAAWKKIKKRKLNNIQKKILHKFLKDRYLNQKSRDIKILNKPLVQQALLKKLNIDHDKPIICLFTQVNWDACFDLATLLFKNANLWVIKSIEAMIKNTNINWIIRVHPGESADGCLYSTEQIIKDNFKKLPSHIKIVSPSDSLNAMGLYKLIDMGITALGTPGLELPLFGKQVLVAGDAHYSKKGFTIDPSSAKEYLQYLVNLRNVHPITKTQLSKAENYAYSYFIERQVPLNVLDPKDGHWGDLDPNKIRLLLPGQDGAIEALCEGIINGQDVILNHQTVLKNWK